MTKLHSSEKGITVVELLAALALMGIIAVIIVTYLTSGMNGFLRVNEEINVHDEANYVMRRFENEILEATNVVKVETDDPLCDEVENCQLITITKTTPPSNENPHSEEEIKVTLGFKDQLAIIDGETISSNIFISEDETRTPTIAVVDNPNPFEWYVQIRLVVENKETEFQVELECQIPFVKVEKGGS